MDFRSLLKQMNQDEFAAIRRQVREQSGWGFVSRYGRTGRIRSISDREKTVQIDIPQGPMLARVGAGTAIQIATAGEARVLAFEDLAPGMLVTVDGKTGTPENAAAGEIEVVPEWEGGFDIQPATGGGPLLVPLLP